MSQPSLHALTLLTNSASPGGLAAVASGTSSLVLSFPHFSQLAKSSCSGNIQHLVCLYGAPASPRLGVRLHSSSVGQLQPITLQIDGASARFGSNVPSCSSQLAAERTSLLPGAAALAVLPLPHRPSRRLAGGWQLPGPSAQHLRAASVTAAGGSGASGSSNDSCSGAATRCGALWRVLLPGVPPVGPAAATSGCSRGGAYPTSLRRCPHISSRALSGCPPAPLSLTSSSLAVPASVSAAWQGLPHNGPLAGLSSWAAVRASVGSGVAPQGLRRELPPLSPPPTAAPPPPPPPPPAKRRGRPRKAAAAEAAAAAPAAAPIPLSDADPVVAAVAEPKRGRRCPRKAASPQTVAATSPPTATAAAAVAAHAGVDAQPLGAAAVAAPDAAVAATGAKHEPPPPLPQQQLQLRDGSPAEAAEEQQQHQQQPGTEVAPMGKRKAGGDRSDDGAVASETSSSWKGGPEVAAAEAVAADSGGGSSSGRGSSRVSVGVRRGAVPTPEGYLEFPEPGCSYSSLGYAGEVGEWYRQHVAEVLSVSARGPGVEPPSLEDFQRQLDVELQTRHLALEEYRRQLDSQVARGAVDESLSGRRLLAEWLPALSSLIEDHIHKFMSLQGEWGSPVAVSGPRGDRSERARARTVGLAYDIEEAAESIVERAKTASTTADSGGGRGSARGGAPRDFAASAAQPLMAELREWVPHVLAVPPQVIARTIIASMLNHAVIRSHNSDTPLGISRSIDTAGIIGDSLHHTVSYMRVCEAVTRKRREVGSAGRRLKEVQQAAERGADRAAERGADRVAERGADRAADCGADRAAEGGADRAAGAAGGGGDGGSSEVPDSERSAVDAQVAEAAARVRAARKALAKLKAAAAAVLPGSAAKELAGSSVARSRPREGQTGEKLVNRRVRQNRTYQLKQLAAEVPGLGEDMQEWTPATRMKVGASLLALAVAALRVRLPEGAEAGSRAGEGETGAKGPRSEPAFSHSTAAVMTFKSGCQTPGLLMAHPQVLRLLEGDEELRRLLQPRIMPMMVEPRPWRGPRGGGMLTTTVPLVKARDSHLLMAELREAHARGRLQPLYDALNVLGNVPWRVNERVFRVMEQVVLCGGGVLSVPPSAPRTAPPRHTTLMNEAVRPYLGDATPDQVGSPFLRLQREGRRGGQLLVGAGALSPAEEAEYQRQCQNVRIANRNESGQRTVLKYRLETARQLLGAAAYDSGTPHRELAGGEGSSSSSSSSLELSSLMLPSLGGPSGKPTLFFQPHNIDFRGRAYPLHPHLNQMGDDGTRALLQFGVGKPLGENGFKWLLVQLANLWGRGVDKYPLAQRVAWAESQLPHVRASAERPLDGGAEAWWRRGERPWQLLATCCDLTAALDWAAAAGGSTAGYISHHPINQDGTCNGLQHYAALARDSGCGAAVNLLPADRPQDVYQAVADAVAERVARERAKGRSEAAKVYGNVDRKLVKQTVMTYVYGVTIIGAREQFENRLEEKGWTNESERRKVATYLARLTFQSMGQVFGPVVAVRGWLDECARFAVSSGHPVCWTSPLGFPIEQPYRKIPTYQVITPLQRITLRDLRHEAQAPVDAMRQRSGFPPNYIHSLDSAHMMMTAAAVRREGGIFAAVHDSFWTHAATVDDMNRKIRDTFVELHTRPLLEELRAEVVANPLYRGARGELPPLPPTGDLRLPPIRDSLYFFS